MLLKISAILSMTVALILAGCGGGGSTTATPATATGQFKDSKTSGLNYASGGQTGVTGADGSFTYEVGQPVTFKIGGVTIGTATGKSAVTPIDLVTAGTSSSAAVQNRVRFLMMLDSDNDATNGITISSAVQAAAASWPQPDFSVPEANFSTAVSGIQAAVNIADSRVPVLPVATVAKTHLESTLRCSYAGAYKGTFAGDDTGQFGVLVDAITGSVSGFAYSNFSAATIGLSGSVPISYDQNAAFVSGNGTGGTTFDGKYTSVNGVSGIWQNASTPTPSIGTFSGSRIGGASNAAYRFTGQYSGSSDNGLMTFDLVTTTNSVTGVGYSVPFNTLFTVTGTLNGNTLTGTTSTGSTITATIAMNSNLSTGTVSGNWTATGGSGIFTGSGCKLN